MAHTPGTWEARPTDGQIVLNGSNCYDIQEIYNDQGGFNPDDIRLMAAAPEMLAALRDTLGELEWLCECHRKCKEEPDAGAYAAIAKARTAILKAEGRD
jgi:hypothetical protein